MLISVTRRLSIFFCIFTIAAVGLFSSVAQTDFRIESLDNNFPEEIQVAADEGKRVVIMFHQTGCPYCDKMRVRVLPDAKVVDYYSDKFVMIESNIRGNLDVVSPDGKQTTEVKMARKLRIRATPVFLFYDKEGKEALRLTGFLDADLFVRAGQYVAEEIYKKPGNVSFYRYLKSDN